MFFGQKNTADIIYIIHYPAFTLYYNYTYNVVLLRFVGFPEICNVFLVLGPFVPLRGNLHAE